MIILQAKNGYRYNCDSIFLYDFALKFMKNENKSLLDVGSGCGILALMIKNSFNKLDVFGVDIQELNYKISKKNAKENHLNIKFFNCDFRDFASDKKFDFIISNPPFYELGSRSQNSHLDTSREALNLDLKSLLKKINSLISPKGKLIMCYDARSLDYLLSELLAYKFKPEVLRFAHSKKDKFSKLVLIKASKSSRAKLEIQAPLFIMDGEEYSKEAMEIFKNINLESQDYEEI